MAYSWLTHLPREQRSEIARRGAVMRWKKHAAAEEMLPSRGRALVQRFQSLFSMEPGEEGILRLLVRGSDVLLSQVFLDLSEGWSPAEISEIRGVDKAQLKDIFTAVAGTCEVPLHEIEEPALPEEPRFVPALVQGTPLPLDVQGPAEGHCWTCGTASAGKFCSKRCKSVWNLKEREKLVQGG